MYLKAQGSSGHLSNTLIPHLLYKQAQLITYAAKNTDYDTMQANKKDLSNTKARDNNQQDSMDSSSNRNASSYNRRSFLKDAAILSGAAGLSSVLPFSIQKAFAINADPGTTFMDAEHIILLMQENRSFDHMFGTLQGVRGFNDPRAKRLPSADKVWIQKDKEGKAICPFHIDIEKTKVTWQGGLPHSWDDQSLARNGGKHDHWIIQKTPMTMGHYNRQDVPFYYQLADCFTICDQNFCSSLTGTTPNRLFYWTGNIRPDKSWGSVAAVGNEFAESRDNAYVDWMTFPEVLEDAGVSWRIYQNELWTPHLQPDNKDYWLGNYGDNSIEYVKRHQVKLSAYFRKNGDHTANPALSPSEVHRKYDQLSQKQKNLIDNAFTTNIDDRDEYLKLAPLSYTDDQGKNWTVELPKADIFKKFRADVDQGSLPTVSWLVAPQAFCDHTSSPLYGTWYVSEVLDILTKNPETWKKTILIINYDENDGYFDHIPPFVVPRPGDQDAGKVSEGIDTHSDYHKTDDRPIGLGYRVPMIVASPWSKGGYVNSQLSDHTSVLQFLEHFLTKKTGKAIECPGISSWRRVISSDLTSIFRPYNGEQFPLPAFLNRDQSVIRIRKAKDKPKQLTPSPLTGQQIQLINNNPSFATAVKDMMSSQEKGTRPACALPYQLSVGSKLDKTHKKLQLIFSSYAAIAHTQDESSKKGAPFNMYTGKTFQGELGKTWFYTVSKDSKLTDEIDLTGFVQADNSQASVHLHSDNLEYDLHIDGPNGFYRGLTGSLQDPELDINWLAPDQVQKSTAKNREVVLAFKNREHKALEIVLTDNLYGMGTKTITILASQHKTLHIPLDKQYGWYDFTIRVKGYAPCQRQYAGHIENGESSRTDPFMGMEV
ncbi:phospholipase C [Arachidicoccus rhizosphaerae]|uniref:Phospholipase C n=2 Tax=Arachidicoccus rhizosphaerae TaxID=551991 RepID=A0A1H4AM26_9BACT|nr:phospholipase C [Arachidicoccus rhizosphaerae]